MIKGCAKRVVVVKDIESNLFEEAFFIVKPGSKSKKYAEEDFLNEAGKIVKHKLPSSEASAALQTGFSTHPTGEVSHSTVYTVTPHTSTAPQKKRRKSAARRDAFMFFCGFGLSAILCTAIYYLRMLL